MYSSFFSENRAVYEVMWKNIVQPPRPQMGLWRMLIVCWIPKAGNTQIIKYPFLFHCNSGYTSGRQF